MNDNGEIDSARCRTEMSETCMMVAGEGKRSRTREGREGQGGGGGVGVVIRESIT